MNKLMIGFLAVVAMLTIGLIIGAKPVQNEVETASLPFYTDVVTINGPWIYSLETGGIVDDTLNFELLVTTFDKNHGTLTEVRINRHTATANFPAIQIDYFGEYTKPSVTDNFSHIWREKGWFSFASFTGTAPATSDQFDTAPLGWVYIWPSTSPYSTTIGPYDGTTDYAGTTGYSGTITGVTSTAYDYTTAQRKLDYFTDDGIETVKLFYSPRLEDYAQGGTPAVPLNHWGSDATDVDFRIDTITVTYVYTIP